MPQVFGRRIHCSPSFQLGVLLRDPIRNKRGTGLHPPLVRYRVPICRGVAITGWVGADLFCDVQNCGGGGCEDETFEGRCFLSGVDDGKRPGDCGVDYGF